ncbi:MAG TPA: caspase family protein [Mycobacteriales bacterium]|nr:caspase family protein [Mycobacteriales bacterium]
MAGWLGTLPAPELPAGRRSALVIATSRYGDPALRQLRAPAQDAAALADVLGDPEIGGFEVTTVTDGTAHQIRLAVAQFLADRSTNDLLVVYLSCHGLCDIQKRLYFATVDTNGERHLLAATAVESRWLLDRLEDCRARRQVIILDCCFSGAFDPRIKGDTDVGLEQRFHGRGRVVLTASEADEYSFESDFAGDPIAGQVSEGSVFTTALIEGLRTGAADADHDGLISVDDAYTYAFEQVRAVSSSQTPQRWVYGAEGSIYLARNPAGVAVTPAPLHADIRGGLESSLPDMRLGAVNALGEWLSDPDPARALAARQTLQEVADNDNPRVGAAARTLLDTHAPSPRPEPMAKAPSPPRNRPPKPPPSPPTSRPSRTSLTTRARATLRRVLPTLTTRTRIALAAAVALLAGAVALVAAWPTGSHGATFVQALTGNTAVYAVAFSPDGKTLATGSGDGTLRLWDYTTGLPIGPPLTGHADSVRAVTFSPDGKTLASASDDRTVRLWNPTTGQPIGQPLKGHNDAIRAMAFSPDGKTLATGSDDHTVRLWNPTTRQPIGPPLTGHTNWVWSVAFSRDGRTLATAGVDENVRLWNPTTRQPIGPPLTGHTDAIQAMAFSPDGKTLATGSDDRTVRLWNPTTRQPIGQPLTGHTGHVRAVAFSPDGKILATGSEDGRVRLWNPTTHQPIGPPLTGHTDWVNAVAFSPDGKTLATGSADDTVRLWKIT